jgi:hypothetical protein
MPRRPYPHMPRLEQQAAARSFQRFSGKVHDMAWFWTGNKQVKAFFQVINVPAVRLAHGAEPSIHTSSSTMLQMLLQNGWETDGKSVGDRQSPTQTQRQPGT